MTDKPSVDALEVNPTPIEEIQEDLYEEMSALEQAMTSEENQIEGTFLTGGNTRDFLQLQDEKEMDEQFILNPRQVRDGPQLLAFFRENLHKFDSPYAYIGGEANSPDMHRYHTADVKILIARLSTYESVSLSMSHSLMAQIYGELPFTFSDLAFLPKPNDYKMLIENGFPVWFGVGTKLKAHRFDVLSITHAVSMEQLNFVPLLHDSGIPLFKEQRMEREDIPLILVGGANSGTTAPLAGDFVDSTGKKWSHLVDAVIYGDGEESAKEFMRVVQEGKQKGWSKREILRNCHGRVMGFYEPDCYVHEFDGKGSITKISRAPGCEYAQFPVTRSTVDNLDTVRTLEQKILPYTGDGASVDVAIAGSVGCIGSAGWGSCSFCREGSEGPYRERSLGKVMDALDSATRNQGTKEVSFFSLNFNQYSDFFPLVAESVKRGYKVGLISQRIDMLAETPEQVKVQRWLKKSNFTLGVEGISGRTRAYLNKNLQEWEILMCAAEMMKEGAGELKFFQIVTGLEQDHDVQEFCSLMEKVNALRQKLGASTRFRVSFTPLFPSAFTALQFAPCNAAIMHGTRSLDKLFGRAKELGWGRRLSVSGEEPLVSNTINHGGRNITTLLIQSHFKDAFRFYGNVPKGTWARWAARIEREPNIDLDITWGEKSFEYIFPWEDIAYSTSKEILWRGYVKAVAYQGVAYCLSTRTIKGVCHVNECGCCDPDKDGKPNTALIKQIVGRRVAPTIPTKDIAAAAQSREKSYHLRVLFRTTDPIYRFVLKGYFQYAIPRALMNVSKKFNDAFVGSIGHARIAAGANMAKDWTFGHNIYDFSLSSHIPESELRAMIVEANKLIREGEILDLRMDTHLTVLRNDVDYAIYSMFIPNSGMSHARIRGDIERYFERKFEGKLGMIKIKKTQGKGVFVTIEKDLGSKDVRQVTYQWMPDHRGTLVRMVISGNYNPMAMLEAVTGRKGFSWKQYPIYCDGYVQLAKDTGETDVFAALAGDVQTCSVTGGPLEIDLFRGEKLKTGVSLAAEGGLEINYPIDMSLFFTRQLQAIDVEPELVAAE
jgi:radical SAM superfamily enzyme YgiQ (UPF0313 family)